MTNSNKIAELAHLIDRAMATCHYGRAEKLFRQLLQEAFESEDKQIIARVSLAFMKCRQLRAIDALQMIKRIDPIQSQRRELS